MGRISIPARGRKCHHIQCFDCETFLQMNNKPENPYTKIECPVCFSIMHFDDLFIDGYFKDILETASPSCDSVQIEEDGKWSEFQKFLGSKRKSGISVDVDSSEKSEF